MKLLGRYGAMHNTEFWKGKKVFITGHTGFKGSWLTLWLSLLGADVRGYSLNIPTTPNLYTVADVSKHCHSIEGDILNPHYLSRCLEEYQPDIIFHLAAQSLVRRSYSDPVETYMTNVIGTVHVLEAARRNRAVQVFINVTSDKCYENNGDVLRGLLESDPMGGHDPYSASKGCAELVTQSFRRSFFQASSIKLASVRAGNVIGGGDWAEDRLIPDIVNAFFTGSSLHIRNPHSIRPWQHVLEPLNGYLCLAEKLWGSDTYCGGWNFGPSQDTHITVEQVISLINASWGKEVNVIYSSSPQPHEAEYLCLDSSKAVQQLNWKPKLQINETLNWTIEWYKEYADGKNMNDFTLKQIRRFQELE